MIQCCGQVAVYLRSSTMTMLKEEEGVGTGSVGGACDCDCTRTKQDRRSPKRTGIQICSASDG
jgi:hypothetical protein